MSGFDINSELSRIFDAAAARDREEKAKAAVVPQRGASVTEYQISGTLESVLKAICALFQQYHPSGYGTYLHSMRYSDQQYIARVSRSNSCE